MAAATDLAKMVPGFEFLQNLMKNAGAAVPGLAGIPSMSQWIAPTLDPAELDKRIQELKTVQFWLDQNAKLLGTTIQALEVQRMTLATLQTMNLPMTDLRNALKINLPKAASKAELETDPEADFEAEGAPAQRKPLARSPAAKAKPAAAGTAPAAIDPLQWWGALTQQFTELASKAVKDSTADMAKNLAGAAVKQGMATAGNTLKKAAGLPAQAARAAARAARSKR